MNGKMSIYHPTSPPQEREEGKKLRQQLKSRRDNGEPNLVIRNHKIVQLKAKQNGDHAVNRVEGFESAGNHADPD